jgi:carboxypeptidase family protein
MKLYSILSIRTAVLRSRPTWPLTLVAIAMAAHLVAQDVNTPKPETAHITGTVTDVNGDALSGATVVLQGPGLKDPRKVPSDDNGFFEFKQLDPGTYRVNITAKDFADWNSPDFALSPGQYLILTDSKLHIAVAVTTLSVGYSAEEVATEQVKVEEKQRVLGVIPNFYVVYDRNPAPLTARLKFHLALKTSTDVVTILGIGVLAGINQAGDTPDYVQGAKGYAQRFGAAAADGFSDIMIGGAILPSLLHQDPRYYYEGTGTKKSRSFHAIASPFVCKGDNGRLQPNYSSLGGDLGSAALSNAYYPASNRGVGLVFQNFFLSTGERIVGSLVQEFVLQKLTHKRRFHSEPSE